MRDAALGFPGNPASQHEVGRRARRAVEKARDRIAGLLAMSLRYGNPTIPEKMPQVILTSGGTESNNLALRGLSGTTPAHVIISALEHPSVTRTAERLAAEGWRVDRLGADASGVVRVDQLLGLFRPDTRLVSVMLASNETGVIQPIAEIAALCAERGVLLHTDATQAVGKIAVDFHAFGVDAMTLAAHKFHGPVGIGALLVRAGVPLASSLHGGFQQAGLRPGTESVALAFGMGAALEAWHAEADARRARMTALRNALERQLLAGDPRAVVIGAAAPRLPHTSNVAFVGLDRQLLAIALDLEGVACSTGSACASGSSEPSPALVAMGLPKEQISASIRLSLGATTTAAEVDEGARRILSVVNRLRRKYSA
jgi:cysteine desulfurase